jgi:type IV pilus assembly protein PilA
MNAQNQNRQAQRGFSLIELMVVIAIIMIIAAMAVPNMMGALANLRMRSSLTSISSLLQQGRIMAVRNNRFMIVRTASAGGAPVAYVDTPPYNGNLDATENLVQPFRTAQVIATLPTGVHAFPDSNLGYAVTGSSNGGTFAIAFNSRGIPCTPNALSSPVSCSTGSGTPYFYFFRMDVATGASYGAISVTPAGRIRSWVYDGNDWK